MVFSSVLGVLVVHLSVGLPFAPWRAATPEPRDTTAVERWVGAEHHRIRVHIRGEGPPTIVLIAGLGGGLDDWSQVAPDLATMARVVSYDRPGLGSSDPGVKPRTAGRMAAELHRMLSDLGIVGPVILCGHSLGGSVAQIYVSRWPRDVSGLLLVDPASWEFFRAAEATIPGYKERRAARARQSLQWPAGIRAELIAMDSSMAEVRQLAPLPSVPMVMLIAGRHGPPPDTPLDSLRNDPVESLWRRVHIQWLQAQPRGSYILDETSDHYIQKDDPALVVRAFRTLVGEIGNH